QNRRSITVAPLQVVLSGNTRLALMVLSAAVLFVLLIACINVANLTMAQGVARSQEMAMRMALGASRGRRVRQLLTGSLLLALISAAAGVGLAVQGIHALVAFGPHDIPRLEQAGVDSGVLAFTLAASVFTAIVFGMLPAWRISRGDPGELLKSGFKGT